MTKQERIFGTSRLRRLLRKLRLDEYRRGYVSAQVRNWVAYQIRALRKQREWSQAELAERAGKPQSVISRLEDPDYGKLTIQSLLDIASAFDVALSVRFVSFSEFLRRSEDVSPAAMTVESYDAVTLSRKMAAASGTPTHEVIVPKEDVLSTCIQQPADRILSVFPSVTNGRPLRSGITVSATRPKEGIRFDA